MVEMSSFSVASEMSSARELISMTLAPRLTLKLEYQTREGVDGSTDHVRGCPGQTGRHHRDELFDIGIDFACASA